MTNPNKWIRITLILKNGQDMVRIEGREYISERKRDEGCEVWLDLTLREWKKLRARIDAAFM